MCLFFSPSLLGLISFSLSSLGFASPPFFFFKVIELGQNRTGLRDGKPENSWKNASQVRLKGRKKETENDHLFTSGRSSSVFKWVQQCLNSTSVLWKRITASRVKIFFFKRVSLGLISSWLPAPTSLPSSEMDLLRRKQSSANRFSQQSSEEIPAKPGVHHRATSSCPLLASRQSHVFDHAMKQSTIP